jgi:hypothetical protein
MKNILVVFNGINAPWHVLTFAITIAKNHEADLKGIFLSPPPHTLDWKYFFPNDLELANPKLANEAVLAEYNRINDDTGRLFKAECERKGVLWKDEKNVPVNQLIDETSQSYIFITDAKAKSYFSEHVLSHVHCPVYFTSEKDMPERVILMYNGAESASFAIEKYKTLLPEFSDLPTDLVSINFPEEKESGKQEYIKNYLQSHFTNLSITPLKGKVEKVLKSFLQQYSEHTLIIMGAFGRTDVSRFFHQSLGNVVLENTRMSLFIAHK